jgi:predicted GIY-YIG superfamily endonuclease
MCSKPPCTLYVVQCVTPNTWYVGTTIRQKHKRFQEHFDGVACKWTMRHGCKRIALSFSVPLNKASEMENDMWMYYARHVCGPERVRGGDVTIVQRHNNDSIPTWLLPEEFGGTRRVDWGIGNELFAN